MNRPTDRLWRWALLAVVGVWAGLRVGAVYAQSHDVQPGDRLMVTVVVGVVVWAVVAGTMFLYRDHAHQRVKEANPGAWFIAKVTDAGGLRGLRTLVVDVDGVTVWNGHSSRPVVERAVRWWQVLGAEPARLQLGVRLYSGIRVTTGDGRVLEVVLPSGLGVDDDRTAEATRLINSHARALPQATQP
jgi:hypothetical protein